MKKTAYALFISITMTFATSISAQDLDNIGQLDMSQIQQLACMANNTNSLSQSSLDNIGSILNETLALYSEQVSQEELQSASDLANQTVSGLDLEANMQKLCDGNQS